MRPKRRGGKSHRRKERNDRKVRRERRAETKVGGG